MATTTSFLRLLVVGLLLVASYPSVLIADLKSYKAMFQPLPDVAQDKDRPLTTARIELGKKLYFEKKLSLAGDLSCNSCHDLKSYGVDNKPVSPGHKGQTGDRNSPSVYNAALHLAQFWDGREPDVEAQALGPVMNPIEMAMPTEAEVEKRLTSDSSYPELFSKAFPEDKKPVTFKNMGVAIGAFERTLLTPSRFDEFLKGKEDALSLEEKEGLKTFVDAGCTTCHNGVGIGGHMYQKLGLVKSYPTKDTGRYKVTKSESDKFVFKVPSLRNITKTGPYFHDGSVKNLHDAVKLMGEHQLGRELDEKQIQSIITFLGALKGELPKEESHS